MNEYMRTIINSVKTWVRGNLDWKKLRNKPFYEEESIKEETYIAETEVTCEYDEQACLAVAQVAPEREIIVGKTYKLRVDSAECVRAALDLEGIAVVGNEALLITLLNGATYDDALATLKENYPGYVETDVDFCLAAANGMALLITRDTATTNHIIEFGLYDVETIVHKLDEKFLPDSLHDVAFSGSYDDLTNTPQDVLKYSAQTLTDEEKTQARENIGAGTSNFSGSYNDLSDAPEVVQADLKEVRTKHPAYIKNGLIKTTKSNPLTIEIDKTSAFTHNGITYYKVGNFESMVSGVETMEIITKTSGGYNCGIQYVKWDLGEDYSEYINGFYTVYFPDDTVNYGKDTKVYVAYNPYALYASIPDAIESAYGAVTVTLDASKLDYSLMRKYTLMGGSKTFDIEIDDDGVMTATDSATDEVTRISSPVKFVENTDSANKIPLRSLESGTYILKGYFTSYEGGTHAYTFSTGMLVAVVYTSSVTYVQIFYPKNNTIQYVEITDTEVMRKDAKLVNMESVANMVTTVDETSDDSHYPSAKAVYDVVESKKSVIITITDNDDGTYATDTAYADIVAAIETGKNVIARRVIVSGSGTTVREYQLAYDYATEDTASTQAVSFVYHFPASASELRAEVISIYDMTHDTVPSAEVAVKSYKYSHAEMVGATETEAGAAGLVPAPAAGMAEGYYLDSNGEWKMLPQSDWNQNDSTAKDYVKNRPFWASDPVETVLLEETELTFVEGGAELPTACQLEEGLTYTVTYNDAIYNCTAWFWESEGIVMIGNGKIVGVNSGNAEPFITDGEYMMSDDASATIKIIGVDQEFHELDEKYIPDSLIGRVATAQTTAETAQTTAETAQTTAETALKYHQANAVIEFVSTDAKTYVATLSGSSKIIASGNVVYPAALEGYAERFCVLYVNDVWVGSVFGIDSAARDTDTAYKENLRIEIIDNVLFFETSEKKKLMGTTIPAFGAIQNNAFAGGARTIKLVFNNDDVTLSGLKIYSTKA